MQEKLAIFSMQANNSHMSTLLTEWNREAVRAAGGYEWWAAKFGVSRTALITWLDQGPPADRLLQIEAVTGIPRHRLRPELYDGYERT